MDKNQLEFEGRMCYTVLQCKPTFWLWASPLLLSNEGYSFTQFSSVAQSCLSLCNSMDCSMPGLRVHHQLLEFTQTHVHWVGDAIQPSQPLSSPSPPALNLSQRQSQSLFKSVSSSHQVAKYWSCSFNISPSNEHPRLISLEWTGWISLQAEGLSRLFSNTTIQKHKFFSAQPYLLSNSHIHTWPLEKP